jgi:hypothetical protein
VQQEQLMKDCRWQLAVLAAVVLAVAVLQP